MLPIAAGDAMRACAIQAMSSMAWSRVWRGDVGGPDGVGPEQRVERGHEAIVCGRWDIRGQVFEQDWPSGHGWSGLAGVARFSFGLIGRGQSRKRQRLFSWPSQV